MSNRTVVVFMIAALLPSCSGEPEQRKRPPSPEEVERATTVARARPAIDPESSEAAELLVRGFVRLVNSAKLADAYRLLGPDAAPRAEFERQ